MSNVRYANRTCHECGAIHPQNEMTRTTVTKESGRSKKTFSILDGNDKRRQDALWGLGGRTYYSKREVWMCGDCTTTSPEDTAGALAVLNWIFIIYCGYAAYINVNHLIDGTGNDAFLNFCLSVLFGSLALLVKFSKGKSE